MFSIVYNSSKNRRDVSKLQSHHQHKPYNGDVMLQTLTHSVEDMQYAYSAILPLVWTMTHTRSFIEIDVMSRLQLNHVY